MKHAFKALMAVLAFAAIAVGCKEVEPEVETSLSVNPTSATFSAASPTAVNVKVTSNAAWTASCDASWITLSAKSGKGDAEVTVSAAENVASDADTEARTAEIRFTAGNKSATVSVNQGGATAPIIPAFEVAPTEIALTAADTRAEVTITGNVAWTVTCPEGVTAEPATGEAGATVALTLAANETINAKEYEVVIATEAEVATKSYTVKISQAGLQLETYTTLADANAAILGGATDFILDLADYTAVTYVLGSYVFVQQVNNNAAIMLAGTGWEGWAAQGMKFKGKFVCKASLVEGHPVITSFQREGDLDKASDYFYPCKNITLAELVENYDNYVNCKVKIDGVTVTEGWGPGDPTGVVAVGEASLPVSFSEAGELKNTIAPETEGNLVAWVTKLGGNALAVFEERYFAVTKEPGGAEYTTLAEANAAIVAGATKFVLNLADYAEVTNIYGDRVYIQQGNDGAILLKGTGLESAGAYGGLRLKGKLTCEAALVDGLPVVNKVDGLAGLEQQHNAAKYPCINLTLADLNNNYSKYFNCKVKIVGVTVEDGWSATDLDGAVSKDGARIAVYVERPDKVKKEVATGCEGDIVAYVGKVAAQNQLGVYSDFTVTKEAGSTALANLGELNAAILAGATEFEVALTTPAEITLMASDNKSVYLQDATGAVLLYSADIYTYLKGKSASAGVGISGTFTGKATIYNGIPEITAIDDPTTIKAAWKGGYPCKNVSVKDILDNVNQYMNCKVAISGVEVTDDFSGTDRNGKVTKDGSEIAVYVKNTSVKDWATTGSKGKLVGFVGINNSTKQVAFWESGKWIPDSIVGAVSVNKSVEVAVGATAELTAKTSSDGTITYSSSNEAVATVSATGVVTGVAAGEAVITAAVAATSKATAASAECKVTVTGAGESHLFSEKFAGNNCTSDSSDSSSKLTTTDLPNFSSLDNVYWARTTVGGVKLGTSSKTGTLVTKELDLSKAFVITVKVASYAAGEGALVIKVDDTEVKTIDATEGGASNKKILEVSVDCSAATAASKITVGTSAKRGYVTSIIVDYK